jgi:ATP adenylyltransferase
VTPDQTSELSIDESAHGAFHQDGIGESDGLERLWTPYRMAYIRGENKPEDPSAAQCPFCRIPSLPDDEALIVHRGELCFVVLNLYPYAPGHVMVCPYRHIANYTDTTVEEAAEMAALTKTAVVALKRISNPAGFNIGMNQGVAGGAGIAAHLHQHIVPRWVGDQNFMPIIGRTKTLPELLGDTRALIAAAWS